MYLMGHWENNRLYFIHHQIYSCFNQLSMMHHQMFKLKSYLFITNFNEKLTNTFNGNITKFNIFLTIILCKITKNIFIYQSPKTLIL